MKYRVIVTGSIGMIKKGGGILECISTYVCAYI